MIVDLDQLLPQTHPFVVATNEAQRLFGSRYPVVIGIESRGGQILPQEVLRATLGITESLRRTEGVVQTSIVSIAAGRVKSIEGDHDGLVVRRFLSSGELQAESSEALLSRVRASRTFGQLLVSKDGAAASVIVDFEKDPHGFRAILKRVQDLVKPFRSANVAISVAGQPIYDGIIESYSDRMIALFPLAILVIGLVHWHAFKSIQGLVLPLITGIFAVVWSVGCFGWLGISLDAFNSTAPILILAVAAGHAVQVLKRYYEEFVVFSADANNTQRSSEVAIISAVASVGPVLIAAGLVAAISFASLAVFQLTTIRLFGLLVALGITSSVVLEIFVIPAVRAVWPAPSKQQLARMGAPSVWSSIVADICEFVIARPTIVAIASFVVTGIALALIPRLTTDNALRSYFADTVLERVDDAHLNRILAGNNVLNVVFRGREDNAMEQPKVLDAIVSAQQFLRREAEVGATSSIADVLLDIDGALAGKSRPAALPKTQAQTAQYLELYSISSEPTDLDTLVSSDHRSARLVAYLKQDGSSYLKSLAIRLRQHLDQTVPQGVEAKIGGTVFTPVALDEVMVENKLLNILQIAACVLVISAIVFESVLAGVLVLFPLAATVACLFGLMGAAGIPLQVVTATTAAIAVGIGADYAIYMLFRLREELRHSESWDDAFRKTFQTSGTAIVFVASAVAAGYAVLMTSIGFMVHFWLGSLIAFSMLVSALASLTTMMAVIYLVRPRFLAGSSK